MLQKRLLIVGIDPGTTLGYAVLDTERNIVKVGSSKLLDMALLTTELISHGRVLVIGCDKKRVPDFVHKMAARLGARIISPDEDMLVSDKKSLSYGLSYNNDHEMDALASALFAFKKIKPTIDEIDDYLGKIGKEGLKHKLAEKMLLNPGFNMKNMIELLEHPNKPEHKVIERVIEEKVYTKKDYLNLFSMLKQAESGNKRLQSENQRLAIFIGKQKNEIRQLDHHIENLTRKEGADKRFGNLRKSQGALISQISAKEQEIMELRNESDSLRTLLSETGNNVVLKKLADLGNNEYEKNSGMLNIIQGDVLLVDNPSVISYKVLDELKGKVAFIISKEKAESRLLEKYGMTILPAKRFFIKEEKHFALVGKKELQKEIEASNLLSNVIASYRDERSRNR